MSEVEIIATENYQYVGQVLGGYKHGKGALIFNDGGYYVGDFAEDRFSGNGTFKFQQAQMTGVFKSGEFNSGQLVYVNNLCQIIDGNYKNIVLNVYNKPYYRFNLQQDHENFQNKLKQINIQETQYAVHFNRDGTLVHTKNPYQVQQVIISSHFIYVGQILQEKMSGAGVLVFNDGSVFNGQFQQGRFQGNGTFTFANGITMNGIFFDGNFCQGQVISLDEKKVVQVLNYEWVKCLKIEEQVGKEKLLDYQLKIQNKTNNITLIDSSNIIIQYQFEANNQSTNKIVVKQHSVTKQNEQNKNEQSSSKNELQTQVQNENDQILDLELQIVNLKSQMKQTILNLTNEYENKLKKQQENYEIQIQQLQLHNTQLQFQIEKQNIKQTTQELIEVQNQADKTKLEMNESNKFTLQFSVKEQSLLNQYNTQRELDKKKLQEEFNVQKKALETEINTHNKNTSIIQQTVQLQDQLIQILTKDQKIVDLSCYAPNSPEYEIDRLQSEIRRINFNSNTQNSTLETSLQTQNKNQEVFNCQKLALETAKLIENECYTDKKQKIKELPDSKILTKDNNEMQTNNKQSNLQQLDENCVSIVIDMKLKSNDQVLKFIKLLQKQMPKSLTAEINIKYDVVVFVHKKDEEETLKTIRKLKIDGKHLQCETYKRQHEGKNIKQKENTQNQQPKSKQNIQETNSDNLQTILIEESREESKNQKMNTQRQSKHNITKQIHQNNIDKNVEQLDGSKQMVKSNKVNKTQIGQAQNFDQTLNSESSGIQINYYESSQSIEISESDDKTNKSGQNTNETKK
ncbi:MORN_motif-containing protein [Hexamita inflata]|uniref:MORN motif-containing protein n=1 Tax=Hexamita inflata TaxID=28002 RepID=A0AA86RPD8_9EUKA|nr:MORN motif-containing protein [Hexamita inflata]